LTIDKQDALQTATRLCLVIAVVDSMQICACRLASTRPRSWSWPVWTTRQPSSKQWVLSTAQQPQTRPVMMHKDVDCLSRWHMQRLGYCQRVALLLLSISSSHRAT